jgi:hypothetical protein
MGLFLWLYMRVSHSYIRRPFSLKRVSLATSKIAKVSLEAPSFLSDFTIETRAA